jgi:hypothetical protein
VGVVGGWTQRPDTGLEASAPPAWLSGRATRPGGGWRR